MWKRTLIIKIAVIALLIGLAVICTSGGSTEPVDWQTGDISADGTVAGCPLGSVLVGDPEQIGLNVRIHMADTFCCEKECRILAVGIDGRTHVGEKTVRFNSSGNQRSTVLIFSDMDLEDIEHFRFQARPYQESIDESGDKRQISDAARKKKLIDHACDGRLWESNYLN